MVRSMRRGNNDCCTLLLLPCLTFGCVCVCARVLVCVCVYVCRTVLVQRREHAEAVAEKEADAKLAQVQGKETSGIKSAKLKPATAKTVTNAAKKEDKGNDEDVSVGDID